MFHAADRTEKQCQTRVHSPFRAREAQHEAERMG